MSRRKGRNEAGKNINEEKGGIRRGERGEGKGKERRRA
jgi:hypothetical protein